MQRASREKNSKQKRDSTLIVQVSGARRGRRAPMRPGQEEGQITDGGLQGNGRGGICAGSERKAEGQGGRTTDNSMRSTLLGPRFSSPPDELPPLCDFLPLLPARISPVVVLHIRPMPPPPSPAPAPSSILLLTSSLPLRIPPTAPSGPNNCVAAPPHFLTPPPVADRPAQDVLATTTHARRQG